MKLPSNRASLVILAIIILTTLIFISSDYVEQDPAQQAEQNAEIVIESNIEESEINADLDGDGLANWEETLWGTDPDKADTDGDGTNDGDEIEAGRNPTIAGPDDEDISPEERILREIEENSEIAADGLTNQVAVDFAENYFLLRGDGSVSSAEKESLINDIVSGSVQNIELNPVYNTYSLVTFDKDEYVDKLSFYAEQLLLAQYSILETAGIDPEQINYTSTGNSMISTSEFLMTLEVPKEIVAKHTELSNTLYHIGLLTKEFEKENKDPLYVMLLLPTYDQLMGSLGDINNSFAEFLKSNDIITEDNGIQIQND